MGVKVITAPTQPVIDLTIVKLQCRIDDAFDDALLTIWIEAARKYCEHYTQRAIGTQTLELALDEFPTNAISLPSGPVSSITSIKYVDLDGIEQTLSGLLYVLDNYSFTHYAMLADGAAWPEILGVANAVKVRYVTGSMPDEVKSAMLLLIGGYHRNREAQIVGLNDDLRFGVNALLDINKVWGV